MPPSPPDAGARSSASDAAAAVTARRKVDHVRITLERDVASRAATGLDRFRLAHCALPEIDLEAVSTAGVFLGRPLRAPILVSSMTGGDPSVGDINRRLAEAAEACGVAMGVGSQRAAIESGALAPTFRVRAVAPHVLLMANLGAIQLNYGFGVDECRRAVEMIDADALILHLNPLQEALQPSGDTRWAGVLARIAAVVGALEVPVVVKEVGWGISGRVARQLRDVGVAAIDVAGAGGTSWSEVEGHRADTELARVVASTFAAWGLPTAEALAEVARDAPGVALVASGGLRDGIDVAKCIALGAGLCGFAGPLLRAAARSGEAAAEAIEAIALTLRVAMFATGSPDLAAMRRPGVLERVPA